MNVLIVDDQPDVQLLLELNVKALGHTTTAVSTAREAIAACSQETPDMLLTDVSMPEMDGPSLVRHLRDAGIEPRVTTLVSAITTAELSALAGQLGVHWLSKPFTFDNVRAALDAAA